MNSYELTREVTRRMTRDELENYCLSAVMAVRSLCESMGISSAAIVFDGGGLTQEQANQLTAAPIRAVEISRQIIAENQ